MTIRESTANQLRDMSRLGVKNKYGEKLWPKEEVVIKDEWEETVVYPGYFNSLGLTRLYYKDKEIDTKNKYCTPYRTYILDVCGHENTFVNQCVDHDRIYLKIVGSAATIEDIEASVKPDFRIENGLTDQEIIEANRRDLMFHKKVVTVEAKFNNAPEKLDKHGQVITNLDHYDNYYYNIGTCEDIVYKIYNSERKKEWLVNKLEYLEERYEKFTEDLGTDSRSRAINALCGLTEIELMFIRRKSGKHIAKHISHICFETNLNEGEVWSVWKYTELEEMENTIFEIKKELEKIENVEEEFFEKFEE